MNLSTIQSAAIKLMGDRRVHHERENGGALYHGVRVANTAITLRKAVLPGEEDHDDILTVASWFHDIGKGIEPHEKYGAVLAREALKELCPSEKLEEILTIIEQHCHRAPKDNNYSPWIKIVQDADLIDHYGTFTVWMDFFYSAFQNKTIEETFDYDQKDWAAHCEKSRNQLNYEISKKIFDEKIIFVNAFYERFRIEGKGGIVLDMEEDIGS